MDCSIDGCERPVYCRGWCKTHYNRWHRTGDPLLLLRFGPRPVPLVDRLTPKIAPRDSGCWEWTGSSDEKGYGEIRVGSVRDGSSRTVPAHRAVYELVVGPIPDGLHLDHLCNNPPCVNPAHLEPVTQAENNRRAAERRNGCLAGHPWTEANTYTRRGGKRECRLCRNARDRVPSVRSRNDVH